MRGRGVTHSSSCGVCLSACLPVCLSAVTDTRGYVPEGYGGLQVPWLWSSCGPRVGSSTSQTHIEPLSANNACSLYTHYPLTVSSPVVFTSDNWLGQSTRRGGAGRGCCCVGLAW